MVSGTDPLLGDTSADSDADGAPRLTRRSLPIALLRARETVMGKFRPMLAEHDINEQQWRVIRVLGEAGELDASELADRALVMAPSLTRMLKALKGRGLIVIKKDKKDGRRLLISLTPDALDLIRIISPKSAAIYRGIETAIGHDELETLLDLLERAARL